MIQLQGVLAADKARSRPLGVVCCIADPDTARILAEVQGREGGEGGGGRA